MVRRFDEASANPSLRPFIHRVSRYLMARGSGQLGEDFRAWDSDGRMTPRLHSELTAYQLCVLDDSFVEGPHASVSRVARSITKPSPAWWSATTRLEQNFREYDRSVSRSLGRFH